MKFFVIDWPAGERDGDSFEDLYDTPEAANRAAEKAWYHLTPAERKKRHIFAAAVTLEDLDPDFAPDEDGVIDWYMWHSLRTFPGAFDSSKL